MLAFPFTHGSGQALRRARNGRICGAHDLGPCPRSPLDPRNPMWKLVIEDDEGKRTVVHLTRDEYSVGRKEGNSIRLTERNISRDHAKLRKVTNGGTSHYVLDDLQSYNGVFVNGIRIADTQDIVHGDLLQIGDYRIVIQDETVNENTTPMEPPADAVATADLKATLAPGRIRRGQQLMERPNRLVMLVGPTPGEEYPLEKDRMVIGRAEDAEVSVNHNSVSRVHCEIHKLGEGRWEIVDKQSSNGVRVNGAELTRGLIEAGDTIELGDVRFRFVGAGQIFLPGSTESQQLTAISDRDADAYMGARAASPAKKPTSFLPFVIAGLVLGAIAVAAIVIFSKPHDGNAQVLPAESGSASTTPTPTATPTQSTPQPATILAQEREILTEAQKKCTVTECDKAHAHLGDIKEGSAARLAPEFLEVEKKWMEIHFAAADKLKDAAKKRAEFTKVAVDGFLRETREAAKAKLAELDGAAAPEATGVPGVPGTTATPKPTATAKASDADRAREMMSSGNLAGARSILEGKARAGKATPEEVQILRSVCKAQGDRACLDRFSK